MAKCGHDICPETRCGVRFMFNGGKRAVCNRRKTCFETHCSSLKALGESGFLLFDACLGHCHRDPSDPKYPGRYQTVDEYLCDNFDPVALVDYFGVNPCGVSDDQTKVGKNEAKENAANLQTTLALLAIATVVGALVWYILKKK